jgi:hypothetical protein
MTVARRAAARTTARIIVVVVVVVVARVCVTCPVGMGDDRITTDRCSTLIYIP